MAPVVAAVDPAADQLSTVHGCQVALTAGVPADVVHLKVVDRLIAELVSASRTAARAGERINTHRHAGTNPDPVDRKVLNAWLSAAITLAEVSCSWPHPQLKAQGALLHHLANDIKGSTRNF